MKYRYFVSYFSQTDNNIMPSIGMCEVCYISKIESFEDIKKIASQIAENLNIEQVIILNYQLIREEPY